MDGSGFEQRFDTYREYTAAMLQTLDSAAGELCVFDPDLSRTGLESAQCVAINAKENPKEYQLARRLLGRAYFKAGRFADAADVFQSIAASNKAPAVKDKAEWDLLLSLLSDYPAQKAKAEKLLDEIIATAGHRYAKRARDLKAELAKIRE